MSNLVWCSVCEEYHDDDDPDNYWDDDVCDNDDYEEGEIEMSIDFTKPVYTWDRGGLSSFSNSLENTLSNASQFAAKNGEFTYVSQMIKKIAPKSEVVVTDMTTA